VRRTICRNSSRKFRGTRASGSRHPPSSLEILKGESR
jgi:hypothetical protein